MTAAATSCLRSTMMSQLEEMVICQLMVWPRIGTVKMEMQIATLTVILIGAWQVGLTRHREALAIENLTMERIAVAEILALATAELHARHGQQTQRQTCHLRARRGQQTQCQTRHGQ